MNSLPRIFITGGTGFIGSEIIRQGLGAGYRMAALVRDPDKLPQDARLTTICGDLSQPDWGAIENFRPTVCLHGAWIATPGIYQTSPANEDYQTWSIRLAERLYTNGLEKFVGLGTCLEYASSTSALDENSPRQADPSSYTRAKFAVLDALETIAPSPQAWAWLRIFYAYGPGEHPGRLIPFAASELAAGRAITLQRPDDVVDYVHVQDIAHAVLVAANPLASGILNVGSGSVTSPREIAVLIAGHFNAIERLTFSPQKNLESRFANTKRLQALGWHPKSRLATALQMICAVTSE